MHTFARAAIAAALTLGLPAAGAADIASLYGTWECRIPGSAPTRTPPILWLAPGTGAAQGQLVVEVDGFARDVAGLADVAALDGGWFRVSLPDGKTLLVREGVAPRGRRAPSMELRRGENAPVYRCLRLPRRDELPPVSNKS
ncbi:MAG: hypothetical protein N2544_03255 [Burkholderiales bacterium]|nr:hypothetical protein [Burkholderiales bacterium]